MTVDRVTCSCTCCPHSGVVPGGASPPRLITPPPENALTPGKVCVSCLKLKRETKDFSCQAAPVDYFTFSAKTCIELIPSLTPKQLDHEVNFCKIMGIDLGLRTRNSSSTPQTKVSALGCTYVDQITQDMNFVIKNCTSNKSPNFKFDLIDNISRLISEAEQLKNELQNITTQNTSTHSHSPTTQPPAVSNSLPSPVSVYNDLDVLHKININDFLCNDIVFKKIGRRKTAYFGSVDYNYGNIKHSSCNYPENPALDKIFDTVANKLNICDFDRDNYTCLITLYESGDSFIPFHSDNEPQIADNSSIVTVSLGESRDIIFKSILDDEIFHTLRHGSVHVMSVTSQLFWEHSIPKSDCNNPRISLTFRKLIPRRRLPPVHRPAPTPHTPPASLSSPTPQPNPKLKPSPRRVLFLTDSIHSRFPTHIFPSDVVFIRKLNFQLMDIDKFRDMFAHVDVVFISCGVNDISRHDKTARHLSEFICDKFNLYSRLYPDTSFIFNSVLLTSHDWLNHEISYLNERVFRVSIKLHNIWFFDSHQVFVGAQYDVLDESHGIHITITAKRHITPFIHRSILDILNHSPFTGDRWPLRPHFNLTAHTH